MLAGKGMHTAWQDSTTWGLVLGGILLLIALRLLQNFLPGRTPPVFEGVPFIGGILKFSKVGLCLSVMPDDLNVITHSLLDNSSDIVVRVQMIVLCRVH